MVNIIDKSKKNEGKRHLEGKEEIIKYLSSKGLINFKEEVSIKKLRHDVTFENSYGLKGSIEIGIPHCRSYLFKERLKKIWKQGFSVFIWFPNGIQDYKLQYKWMGIYDYFLTTTEGCCMECAKYYPSELFHKGSQPWNLGWDKIKETENDNDAYSFLYNSIWWIDLDMLFDEKIHDDFHKYLKKIQEELIN